MELINVIESGNFYEAKKADRFIGSLEFKNWLANTSKLYVGQEEFIYKPNFFQTKFELKRGDEIVLQARSVGGDIEFIFSGNEKFFLKDKGFFKRGYLLYDEVGKVIFEIKSWFTWQNLNSGYSIRCMNGFTGGREEVILVLLCVYHYILDQQAG